MHARLLEALPRINTFIKNAGLPNELVEQQLGKRTITRCADFSEMMELRCSLIMFNHDFSYLRILVSEGSGDQQSGAKEHKAADATPMF